MPQKTPTNKSNSYDDQITLKEFIITWSSYIGILTVILYPFLAITTTVWALVCTVLITIAFLIVFKNISSAAKQRVLRFVEYYFSPWLQKLMPAFVPIILVVVFLNWLDVKPIKDKVEVDFDNTYSELYSSCQNKAFAYTIGIEGENRRNWAVPFKKDGDKSTAYFDYWRERIDDKSHFVNIGDIDNAGGILLFYNRPIDRIKYKTLSFELRITKTQNLITPKDACIGEKPPDVGIRLVVDDDKEISDTLRRRGNRELTNYELPSLAQYVKKTIMSTWMKFEIKIKDIPEKSSITNFPSGLDRNTINKLVFFIDKAKVEGCSNARIWVREISFTR